MLKERGFHIEQLKLDYPEVQADTLKEVVKGSLEWLSRRSEDNLLVDDSGLFVESLGGFPGVYSSYVFRTVGCRGVLKLLQDSDDRGARFEACFGLLRGGESLIFEGHCPGVIGAEERGGGGFGFDPIFVPEGETRTFAQMSLTEKNALSHRGLAVEELAQYLEAQI